MVAGSIVYVQPTKYLPKHERFTSSKVDTNRQIIYVFHFSGGGGVVAKSCPILQPHGL